MMGDQVVPDEYGDLLAKITAEVRTMRAFAAAWPDGSISLRSVLGTLSS